MKKSIALSLFLHLLLLLSLLFPGLSGTSQVENQPVDIIPITETIDMSPVDLKGLGEAPKPKKVEDGVHECGKNWYGGIGVTWNGGNLSSHVGVVEEAPSGYPAANAGIVAGDMINSMEEIRGEPGTSVQVTIVHKTGVSEVLWIVRGRICTRDTSARFHP